MLVVLLALGSFFLFPQLEKLEPRQAAASNRFDPPVGQAVPPANSSAVPRCHALPLCTRPTMANRPPYLPASRTPSFFNIVIIGHQFVKADCSKFSPTNPVNRNHPGCTQ